MLTEVTGVFSAMLGQSTEGAEKHAGICGWAALWMCGRWHRAAEGGWTQGIRQCRPQTPTSLAWGFDDVSSSQQKHLVWKDSCAGHWAWPEHAGTAVPKTLYGYHIWTPLPVPSTQHMFLEQINALQKSRTPPPHPTFSFLGFSQC